MTRLRSVNKLDMFTAVIAEELILSQMIILTLFDLVILTGIALSKGNLRNLQFPGEQRASN